MSDPAADYALMDRAVTALESIAWSLTMIEKHLTPQGQKQEYHFDTIPGLDDLVEQPTKRHPVASETGDFGVDGNVQRALSEELDVASLAREAEALLNAASTPEVRTGVDIGEGERPTKQVVKINLFQQERLDINDLVERCQDDPIIKEYVRKRDLPEQTVNATLILGAAISLVYKHLPTEMWGGEEAAKAVKQFVSQHSEEQ